MTYRKGMTVFIVTQTESGGAQAAAIRLAEEFRQRGHAAETWFLYKKTDSYVGQPYVRVMVQSASRNPISLVKLCWLLYRSFRKADVSAVVSFTHYSNVICQPIAVIAGVALRVASQRNPYYSYPWVAKILDRIWGWVGVYTANTAVSHDTAQSFQWHGPRYLKKMRVIPNGLPAFPHNATFGDGRRKLGLTNQDFVAFSIGRLTEQKNHSTLIGALKHAPSVHLVIAGEGPLRRNLCDLAEREGVQGRVHLLGEVTRARVVDWLLDANCFVMPSEFEGMSNALLEALQAGQAIIASNIPSQREVLMAGGEPSAGILLPANEVDAWASTLTALRGDPVRREELRRRAREVSVQFNIETTATRFLELLN